MTKKLRAVLLRRLGLLVDAAFIPAALIASWALFAVRGIPMTHDGMGFVRVESYRRAYRAGNYFPVWTPFMSNGHGSPFPILYHRLHDQVFGAVALLIGPVHAVKLSVPLLLVVGAAGMRRLCLQQGVRSWVAWVAGVLFLSSNYVFCDWFIRGAIAEFTAFMLLPWCLLYAIRTFDEISRPVWMAVWGAALFFAHMMTAYFYAYFVATIVIVRLLRLRGFGWRRTFETWRRLAVFSALVLAATGFFAAAAQYALAFSHVNTFGMRPDKEAYFTWTATVLDPNLSWVTAFHTGEMSVEVGRWPLLVLVVALLVNRDGLRAVWKGTYGMLVPTVLFFVLQDKRLSFLFDLVPGASRVQFPCRLLAFIVPVMLLAWGLAIESALRSRAPVARWLAWLSPVAAVAQLNLIAQLQRDIRHHEYEIGTVEVALWDRDITQPPLLIYSTWDGFLPEGLRTIARAPFLAASDGCSVSSSRLTRNQSVASVEDEVDFTSFELTVHGVGCSVHFSQFRTPLIAVEMSPPGTTHLASDGTTIIDAPSDGTVVRIRQRSIHELAWDWLIWKLRSVSS